MGDFIHDIEASIISGIRGLRMWHPWALDKSLYCSLHPVIVTSVWSNTVVWEHWADKEGVGEGHQKAYRGSTYTDCSL